MGTESRLDIVKCMAEIEASYGTAPSWTPADDGFFLVDTSNPIQLDTAFVEPRYLRDTFTPLKSIIGRQLLRFDPKVYVQGGGAAATPVRFNDLLRACLLQETVAASSVVYTPRTSSLESASVLLELDGVKYQANGLYGNFVLTAQAGQPAELQFNMTGLYNKPATVSTEFSGFDGGSNAAEAFKGASFSIDNGTVVWSESNPSGKELVGKSLTFNRGVEVGERLDFNDSDAFAGLGITRTRPTLEVVIEAKNTMSGIPDFWGDLTSGVTHHIEWQIGSSAGNIWVVDIPTAQLTNVTPQDGEAGTRNYVLSYAIQHDTAESEFSFVTK